MGSHNIVTDASRFNDQSAVKNVKLIASMLEIVSNLCNFFFSVFNFLNKNNHVLYWTDVGRLCGIGKRDGYLYPFVIVI